MPTGTSPISAHPYRAICLGLLLSLLAISGCAPSTKEIAAADFGPQPDHFERLIQQQLDVTLFSGRPGDYVFKEPPYKAAVNPSLFGKTEFGWVVEVEAKGQIAMGTGGFRTYHCFFPNDGTMKVLTNDATVHRITDK